MADRALLEPLPGGGVEVADGVMLFACRLDDDRAMKLDEGRALLSSAEVTRAARFHFERDRNRYIRGRAFMRRELGFALGADPSTLTLIEDAGGKPRLAGTRLEFNLSHSGDLAVLAISQSGPVGVDVELFDRRINVTDLAPSVFVKAEIDTLLALPEAQRQGCFLAFWTAKEARMKLTGEGMRLDPRHIALDLRDGRPIGYLQPATPAARALFVDPGDPRAICCLSLLGRQ